MSSIKNLDIKVFFSLIIITYCFSFLPEYNIGNLNYMLMIGCVLYCIFIKYKYLIFSTNMKLISIFFISGYIIIPFIQAIFYQEYRVIIYSILHSFYLLFIIFVCYGDRENNINDFIIIFWSITCIFILYQFYKNPSNLFDLNNLSTLFDRDMRVKTYYGFDSTNTIGNICFGNIIASSLIIFEKKSLNIIKLLVNIFILGILLSTASRTPIICLSIFYIFKVIIKYLISKKYNFISINKNAIKLFLLLLIILSIFIFIAISKYIDYDYINYITSNRFYGWRDTLAYLNDKNKIVLGLGFLNPEYIFRSGVYEKLIADNWYIYIIITTGIIGLTINIGMILYIFRLLLNQIKYIQIKYISSTISFFISKLIYGFFEITFFTPSDLTGLLLFISIFSCLIYKKNNKGVLYEKV